MPDEGDRYLLGKGETLTESVSLARGSGEKQHPYTFDQAKTRLANPLRRVSTVLTSLPAAACPNNEGVAVVTLHPSYLAKSYFPEELLGAVGLRSVGSRTTRVRPERTVGARQSDRDLTSVEIYAAGKRTFFAAWAETLATWRETQPGASELPELERVYVEDAESRLRIQEPTTLLEAVLHVGNGTLNLNP